MFSTTAPKFIIVAIIILLLSGCGISDSDPTEVKQVPVASVLQQRFTYNTITGVLTSYVNYVQTPNGVITQSTSFNGPGVDGQWETPDDTFSGYSKTVLNANGEYLISASINNPGLDGIWYTDDDIPSSSYSEFRYDGNDMLVRRVTHNAAGPDGMWFTADDPISGYMNYPYSQTGERVTDGEQYTGAGVDGNWFTPDDIFFRGFPETYNNGLRVRVTRITGLGPDGILHTTDDVLERYTDYYYDLEGREVKNVTYINEGANGDWFDNDDVILGYLTWQYTVSRKIRIRYTGTGPDGFWFTADDLPTNIWVYDLDSDGNETKFTYYFPGLDDLPLTPDDVVYEYRVSENDNGVLSKSTSYRDPGMDGIWFNDNDIRSEMKKYTPYYAPIKQTQFSLF